MTVIYKEPIVVKLLSNQLERLEKNKTVYLSDKEMHLSSLLEVEKILKETEASIAECKLELAKFFTITGSTGISTGISINNVFPGCCTNVQSNNK